ncbi:hypothetical protein CEXT_36261 [Caerostris extrusa]|uniref:ATP synthase F0 subunit 8 n=1 Tax=Caerostris extrusa TaxID=172846 RepID=A0AAV4R7Q9_CAEEX|nr:hypothetical protein CEXT_36261 [Caerostris extrusa]
MYWIGFHAVLFWFLFAEFYKNAYKKRKDKAKELKEKQEASPVKNGYKLTNGHSYSNGYTKWICPTKNVYTNDNGYIPICL